MPRWRRVTGDGCRLAVLHIVPLIVSCAPLGSRRTSAFLVPGAWTTPDGQTLVRRTCCSSTATTAYLGLQDKRGMTTPQFPYRLRLCLLWALLRAGGSTQPFHYLRTPRWLCAFPQRKLHASHTRCASFFSLRTCAGARHARRTAAARVFALTRAGQSWCDLVTSSTFLHYVGWFARG